MITAATRVVALLGHPVAHSVSPQLHNAAFAAADVDAAYVALDVEPAAVEAAVRGLGALRFLGANVTVPHKQAVYDLIDRRTDEAVACGAANTLFFDGDALVADNTDVAGLSVVLRDDVGLEQGDPVVLFGAGGASRAAAVALGRAGAVVDVLARRAEAAEEIADLVRASGGRSGASRRPRLVVNATPLGLHGESLPPALLGFEADQTALDLVYGPVPTPFVAAARAAGAIGLDGRGMLVAQAAASFQRWTGTPAPLDVLRDAVESALKPAAQP